MRQDFEKLFKNLRHINPPQGMSDSIFEKIRIYRKRKEIIKLFGSFSLFFISASSFVPIVGYIKAEFLKSGFYEYISIIFWEKSLILSFWKDFLFSFAESLPIIGLALLLSAIFGILISLKEISSVKFNNLLIRN